ncbi:transcription termination factor MTERF9, chloroplastic-like [Magnolia sinica]|uniref:transcription termination factor MTERF9, chloroplastic-like n=1 Tax=Magnolia sinica TaxID=86752 RepID=UPI00265843F1|nr:transcription termination factor MTERF9, chloroplastic-like [Magnolia sinica]
MSNFPYKRILRFHFLQNPSLKSFTTASTTPLQSFTAQYLIKSCGLPLETALSISKRLHLQENNLQKPDSVLTFFKSHGFSETHITKVIAKLPGLLQSRIDNNLKPKMQFFLAMGFSNSTLPELIASNPLILRRSLINHLRPSFYFLKSFLETNENVITAIRRSRWLLTYDLKGILRPNLNLLVNRGVPTSCISKLILSKPRAIMLKVNLFANIVERVEKLGIMPGSPMFVHAIRGMSTMNNSSWESKLAFLKSLGWSEEEIMIIFKREPICMTCSKEKIRRVVDFFVNTLKFDHSMLLTNPKLFMYGLDKRIFPRCAVIQVLHSKKLLTKDKKLIWIFYLPEKRFLENYKLIWIFYLPEKRFLENYKLIWIFYLPEKRFLENYVIRYVDEVPGLMEMYRRGIAVGQFDSKDRKVVL